MPRPEIESHRRKIPLSQSDSIRVEMRGLDTNVAKRVTITSRDGSVSVKLYRDGSLGINTSGDSGVGEMVILGSIGSLEGVLRELKPKKTTKR